jgi:CBS domain-containing protein
MRAADVMQKGVLCVSPELSAGDFEEFLTSEDISGAPVVNDDGVLVGIATKTDLVRNYMEEVRSQLTDIDSDFTVEEIMSTDAVCVSPDDDLKTVAAGMVDAHVHRVLVQEDGELLGIITSFDLLKLFAR